MRSSRPRPVSTYRLQLRGRPLNRSPSPTPRTCSTTSTISGVTHVYLSPILTAVNGSTHGYDVTDPTTVSDELGGAERARRGCPTRHAARGMGLVVDIVPNHVGVDDPRRTRGGGMCCGTAANRQFATYFDIDWELGQRRGRQPGPAGAADLTTTSRDLTVDGDRAARCGDLAFPIAPGTDDGTGREVHDRQHYRLIGWRRGLCGYRRFFAITSLAGLRQEDRAVFEATHRGGTPLVRATDLSTACASTIPTGCRDPAEYLDVAARDRSARTAWIVIEKILAVDEPLDPTLPIGGHHRLRRAARNRRAVRRSHRRSRRSPRCPIPPGTDYAAMPTLCPRTEGRGR